MDILNSAWLLSMLKKSGGSSQQRLLSLFDILGDWLDAPHLGLIAALQNRKTLGLNEEGLSPDLLLAYLTEEAKASGAQAPEALAQQLYFMALGALQEELRTPGCGAVTHAGQAAKALICAQTEKEHFKNRPLAYRLAVSGLAASLFVMAGASGLMLIGIFNPQSPRIVASNALPSKPVFQTAEVIASPTQTAEMYSSIEQMRQGVCHFPEALMLPEAHRAVYMENVVGGEVSTKASERELAGQLMRKVQCDYAPMLMKNSIG